jgi:hypothetical protein
MNPGQIWGCEGVSDTLYYIRKVVGHGSKYVYYFPFILPADRKTMSDSDIIRYAEKLDKTEIDRVQTYRRFKRNFDLVIAEEKPRQNQPINIKAKFVL